MAIVLFAFNAQLFFIRESKKDSNGLKQCIWIRVNQGIYFQIDAFLYSFIPLSVMFTSNCLIILKFMLAKWNNRNSGSESVNQALSKSAVKGSVMLLTVSFAFLILTGPMCVYTSIIENDPPRLLYGVAAILQYLNHSINGLLYCISGSRFRHEFAQLFKCSRKEVTVRSSAVTTSTSYISNTDSPNSTNIKIS